MNDNYWLSFYALLILNNNNDFVMDLLFLIPISCTMVEAP